MTETVVIQSHASTSDPLIGRMTASVQHWAGARGYAYRFRDDGLFDALPPWVLPKVGDRRQMAADIARLIWIDDLLNQGAERVVWLDADVFIYAPDRFELQPQQDFAFGREYWIVPDRKGGLKVHKNVHNAILDFSHAGQTTLRFYRDTALRLLGDATDTVPPQFVGPKLLTAFHNVAQFPLTDVVGMASPLVLRDLARGEGPAWRRLQSLHGPDLAALNLCSSMWGTTTDDVTLSRGMIFEVVDGLSDVERMPRRPVNVGVY